MTKTTKMAIRKRFNSGHYTKAYLAGMYGVTVEEVDDALVLARRDKLDAVRKRVDARRRVKA